MRKDAFISSKLLHSFLKNTICLTHGLTTFMEYQTIAHLFGIAHLTICEMVHKICQCIIDALIVD